MTLDSDDLLAQIRADFPDQYERSQLRLLASRQDEEITRLAAENAKLRAELEARDRAAADTAAQPAGSRWGSLAEATDAR